MATEVTVVISGEQRKLAFYVNDADWGASLSDIRVIFKKQDIEIPNEFRFLSPVGNIISMVLEKTLTLREVKRTIKLKEEYESEPNKANESESEAKSEVSDEGIESRLEIHIIPVLCDGDPNERTDQEQDSVPNEAQTQTSGIMGQSACPFHCLKEMFNVHNHVNVKMLLKLLFILTFFLTCMMFMLTCTLHMLTSMTNFGEIFQSISSTPGDSEAIMNLRLNFNELEVTTKYEIQDVKKRLAELEEMYLRDIKIQMKDLTSIKTQQSELEATYQWDIQELNGKLDRLAGTGFTSDGDDPMATDVNFDEISQTNQKEGRKERKRNEKRQEKDRKQEKKLGKN